MSDTLNVLSRAQLITVEPNSGSVSVTTDYYFYIQIVSIIASPEVG